MLRRHGVTGALNRIIEYHGQGLEHLSAMDRHVIANMGAELGATTTVFPADDAVRAFLRAEGREDDFTELTADSDAGCRRGTGQGAQHLRAARLPGTAGADRGAGAAQAGPRSWPRPAATS